MVVISTRWCFCKYTFLGLLLIIIISQLILRIRAWMNWNAKAAWRLYSDCLLQKRLLHQFWCWNWNFPGYPQIFQDTTTIQNQPFYVIKTSTATVLVMQINGSLSSTMKDVNYLRHVNDEKCTNKFVSLHKHSTMWIPIPFFAFMLIFTYINCNLIEYGPRSKTC